MIAVVGSPLKEVLYKQKKNIEKSIILDQLSLEKDKYLLVSIHRQENVNSKLRLSKVIKALEETHLRFQLPSRGIKAVTPTGFHDYIKLQQNARVVISDSGSISEESAILGFPAITIRDSMERPEALEAGSIVLSGTTIESITRALDAVMILNQATNIPVEYEIMDTSRRVTAFILSTLPNHAAWIGLSLQ
jgi:UDP-N-acetylglucosamine 2-epimerase (non-hydrolysing)